MKCSSCKLRLECLTDTDEELCLAKRRLLSIAIRHLMDLLSESISRYRSTRTFKVRLRSLVVTYGFEKSFPGVRIVRRMQAMAFLRMHARHIPGWRLNANHNAFIPLMRGYYR